MKRRDFFRQAVGVVGVAAQPAHWTAAVAHVAKADTDTGEMGSTEADLATAGSSANGQDQGVNGGNKAIRFPRVFKEDALKMIAFPLGGVAAGSIALGGRGQLRDWEIFNRPNKGFAPPYCFPSIWIKSGDADPVAHVLESRILPPYEGANGLDSANAPGLSRLASAEFIGQYPFAKVNFQDERLPVEVELEAFSPFIPHDPDDSGLPVAILRYRVSNRGKVRAEVGIAFSIENPVRAESGGYWVSNPPKVDRRVNEYREESGLKGIVMSNPGLPDGDHLAGTFVLAAIDSPGARTSYWRGWPKGRWWNSPLLFWDAFSRDGALLEEPKEMGMVGAISQQHTITPGDSAAFTFLLSWHFPNRTPAWCGWDSPEGLGETIIGNFYSTRFKSAWDAARYASANLMRLETRTRNFAEALRESTVPDAVKEAASANISILATTTCFRTADGEFHGFEGSGDKSGCCFGNCTHVWNYETATAFLFPSFARSLRQAAFGYSMDEQGGMRFRQLLPDGKERWKIAAADGQMGQIIHACLDWKLSGDDEWLVKMWPRIKKGMEFAWIKGGWDSSRRGVFDGVQHTTYDVEFYGPNPLGGIYYLGALRAAEEMAVAVGATAEAKEYRRLFESGSRWIDEHLFQGEYYKQEIRGFPKDQVASQLISGFGSDDTEEPEYQVGGGCLIDQLLGQCLADVAGLGPLVSPDHVRQTLKSIYNYNYKRSLIDHNSVQRTYALNDEAAVVVCDYGKSIRPKIPFPYYAEAWTGLEHSTAALMFYAGMTEEGIEYVNNLRSRYDGIKRNPWDEAECGHHYARAMSSWSSLVALSGFEYHGSNQSVVVVPRMAHGAFRCFWSTASGWGVFSLDAIGDAGAHLNIRVLGGSLKCRSVEMVARGQASTVRRNNQNVAHKAEHKDRRTVLRFEAGELVAEGGSLQVEVDG